MNIKNYILKIFFLSIFCVLIYYFNITIFLLNTAYCIGEDQDDINVKIPGSFVREFKKAIPDMAWATKDVFIVGSIASVSKGIPPTARIGAVCLGFASIKFGETATKLIHNKFQMDALTEDQTKKDNGIKIPSVVESTFNWINGIFENMSDIQILATCCAGLITICIILFTFLTLWVIGREYANKAKSFMFKYPTLNKLFLFYLKWGELTSIPVRLFFVCLMYVDLSLALYFLTYIPLFLK